MGADAVARRIRKRLMPVNVRRRLFPMQPSPQALDKPAACDSLAVVMLPSPSLRRDPAITLAPEVAARRLRSRPGFVWLDTSNQPDQCALSLLAAEPREILTGDLEDVAPLRTALASLPPGKLADLGIPGPGLIGTVDFDGRYRFGLYDQILCYQHALGRWSEIGSLSRHLEVEPPAFPSPAPIDFRPCWSREGYIAAVRKALEYIASGDIYQVNLAQPWSARWPSGADAFPFYEALRQFSPSPHAAFLDLGGRQIASASPELFLRLSGAHVRTQPIKGTRPRQRDAQHDERAAYDLITSSKEIAELIMITDLERNDLGRVCAYGSVTVTELLKLVRFQQVFHLISTVEGTLRPGADHLDALVACFPGGSISGAPKKRALEIIHELEPFPRGLYTGCIGYFGANGESQFSIAIRTAIAERDTIHFHAGAGIVADSVPEFEEQETWHKAVTLLGALRWR
jgi:para-aminobenzoate synthetase component I